jgi:phosphatidylserine/phosphatidylglycerophosphate/cardiolipin synthase-like enzyme
LCARSSSYLEVSDVARPILGEIAKARKTICVKMFVFSDRALLQAIVAAGRRGVQVRLMLNPAASLLAIPEHHDKLKKGAWSGRTHARPTSSHLTVHRPR